MKNIYRIALTAVTVLSSLCANAQDVILDKQVKDNENGTYTLTLESYVTGTSVKQPVDIVLVLDNSNSMYAYNTGSTQTKRAAALKTAVKAFLDNLVSNSNGLAHQVSIVKFQGGGRRIYSYLDIAPDNLRATDICGRWIQMNSTDISYAKAQVDDMHSAENDTPKDTGTPAADGLYLANQLISASPIATDGRKKVIIFFTDGCCGTGESWGVTDSGHNGNSQSYDHDWGYNNGTVIPNRYYAQNVVDQANILKSKATIFSVGTFGAFSDDGQKGDTYFYLRHVSSEYNTEIHVSGTIPETPEKGKITDAQHPTPGTAADAYNKNFVSVNSGDRNLTIADGELIFDASSPTALTTAFSNILQEIIKAPELEAETTVVLDAMSDKFRLPAETITDKTRIKLYTCDATSTTPTWKQEGGKEKWDAFNGTIDINPSTSVAGEIATDVVQVSGFDFKANFVGTHPGESTFFGKKLIIQFDIIPEPSNPGGITDMKTNDAKSGIYAQGEDGEYTNVKYFNQPEVYLPYIRITKQGLKKGESATFKITKPSDANVSNGYEAMIVLTKTSDADPYAVLKLVYSGQYTVEELDWSWAYSLDSSTPYKQTKTLSTVEVSGAYVDFTFKNNAKANAPEHDESYVINNLNVNRAVGDDK